MERAVRPVGNRVVSNKFAQAAADAKEEMRCNVRYRFWEESAGPMRRRRAPRSPNGLM